MGTSPTLRHALTAACLVLLFGCMPSKAGSHDPDKSLMYVGMMGTELAMLADDTFDSASDWDLLDYNIKEMRAAMQGLPADDPRTKKAAALVEEAARHVAEFDKAMPEVKAAHDASEAFVPSAFQASAKWDEVLRGMAESNAPVAQILIANRQVVLMDRMSRRATDMLEGHERAKSSADALERDMAVYQQVLEAMISGGAEIGVDKVRSARAQAALGELKSLHAKQHAEVQGLLQRWQAIAAARQAADGMKQVQRQLFEAMPRAY